MTYLSDTLTIGLVLVLLFGSVALYLYTRLQQSEQKISLLESILLDLKMSSEIRSYSELPADEEVVKSKSESVLDLPANTYTAFSENEVDELDTSTVLDINTESSVLFAVEDDVNAVEEYKSVVSDAVSDDSETKQSSYDNMTLKELQTVAKTRGITGAGTMKKVSLVEALKTSDRHTTVKSGSLSSSSFLETSASVSDE